MAISLDAATDELSGTQSSGANPITASHTTGSGSGRVMLVALGYDSEGASVVSAEYNGTAMAQLGSNVIPGGTAGTLRLFRLTNPDSGAHDVVIELDADVNWNMVVATFDGVDQTTPNDTAESAGTSTGTSISDAIASETGDVVFAVGTQSSGLNPMTVSGTPTQTVIGEVDQNDRMTVTTAAGTTSVTSKFDGLNNGKILIHVNLNAAATGLGTPTGLTATAQSSTQIDLSWNSVADATGYDIERDSVTIVTNHQTTSYSDTGLDPFTEYDYRVRARKAS